MQAELNWSGECQMLATKRRREAGAQQSRSSVFDQHNSCFSKLNICSSPSLYLYSQAVTIPSVPAPDIRKPTCTQSSRSPRSITQLLETISSILEKEDFTRNIDGGLQWLTISGKSGIWFWAFQHNLRLNNRTDVSAVLALSQGGSVAWWNTKCGQPIHYCGGQRELEVRADTGLVTLLENYNLQLTIITHITPAILLDSTSNCQISRHSDIENIIKQWYASCKNCQQQCGR